MKKSKNNILSVKGLSLPFFLVLLLVSNGSFAVGILATFVDGTNNQTGDKIKSEDNTLNPAGKTSVSEIPLGMSFFSDRPTQAKSFSSGDGIVRGQLQTGATPFTASLISLWSEVFLKDSDDATFEFNITKSFLQLQNETTSEASASLWFRVELISDNGGDTVFEHTASISGRGGTSANNTYEIDFSVGQMTGTYIEYDLFEDPANPIDRISVAELELDPYTGTVDLSDILVGSNFEISYVLEMSVEGAGSESWSTALFSDPADFESGGVTTAFTGLTPVPAVVPVPAAVWLFATGLLGLLGINRRRTI